MKGSPEKGDKIKSEQLRRKQIEATLNQLHRLQAEIYELNIPENPHSTAPLKKEVKQLAYLYENMTKPKTKNNLNIHRQDIESAMKLIEKHDASTPVKLDSRRLSSLMKEMFGSELEVGLIKKGDSKHGALTVQELDEFINYNQFDGFDPIRDTYNLFIDENSKFNYAKYKQLNQILGLPAITNDHAFKATLGLNEHDELSYDQFVTIMNIKNEKP